MPRPPKARTPLVEPAAARAAYDAHSARFAALEGPAPAAPSEPRGAVSAALELAATVADPAVRARFATLPAELFDSAQLDELTALAQSLAHCLAEQEAAAEARGEVVLDEALATRAAELRARMLKVVIHYFEDDSELAAEVKTLGRRKSHDATISDLHKLAAIYAARREVVEKDPKYWRTTDEADARAAAAEMETALAAAQGEAEQRWSELIARIHDLLVAAMQDVRVTGQWLFRKGGAERFGVRAVARAKRGTGRRRKGEGAEGTEGAEGAEGEANGDEAEGEASDGEAPEAPKADTADGGA